MAKVADLKAEGAAAFSTGKWRDALTAYGRAVEANETDDTAFDPRMNAILKSNISLCYVKLGHYEDAEKAAKGAVADDATWPRGYQRLGIALMNQGKTTAALKKLSKSLELDSTNEGVAVAIAECREMDKIEVHCCVDMMMDQIQPRLQSGRTSTGAIDDSAITIQLKEFRGDYHSFLGPFLGDGTKEGGGPRYAFFWSLDFPPEDKMDQFVSGVRTFVQGGGILIHMGGTFKVEGLWEKVFPDLTWKDGGYHRDQVTLSPEGFEGSKMWRQGLPREYNGKFAWISNVPVHEALYNAPQDSRDPYADASDTDLPTGLCGAALHRSGKGAVLFIGDVNFEGAMVDLVKSTLKGEHAANLRRDCKQEEEDRRAAALVEEARGGPKIGEMQEGGEAKQSGGNPADAASSIPEIGTRRAHAPGQFKCPSCLKTLPPQPQNAGGRTTIKCKADRCKKLCWIEGDTIGLVATGRPVVFQCPLCNKQNQHSQSDQFDADCAHCSKGLRLHGSQAKAIFDYHCPACTMSMMHVRPPKEVYPCPCHNCGTLMRVQGETARVNYECDQCRFPVQDQQLTTQRGVTLNANGYAVDSTSEGRMMTTKTNCLMCKKELVLRGPFVNGKTSGGQKSQDEMMALLQRMRPGGL